MVKKTHEKFIKELYEINKNIEILSKYNGDKNKVKCRCKICGFEWETHAGNILRGRGCKKCYYEKIRKRQTKTTEQFVKEMHDINPNIKIIGEYIGAKSKIECECFMHKEKFFMMPTHLLRGKIGCKKCIKNKFHNAGLKSHEQFVNEINDINRNIKVLGIYDGAFKHIEVQCLKCGHIWNPQAGSLLSGSGCPCCKRSKGEEKIEDFLINHNIDFESQKKFENLRNKLPLSYDFYLPDYNLLIEYQGQFHDGTTSMVDKEKYFERQKFNDELKRNYALKNNYNLLEIWYYDYKNIECIINKYIYNLKNPVTTTV